MNFKWNRIGIGFFALVLILVLAACGGDNTDTKASNNDSNNGGASDGDGYMIGWSTIYLTPSWMQQTNKMMDDRIEKWKDEGVVSKYEVANADGDTSKQISQIENMISQNYDAILIDAGSSTALNTVIEKAMDKGITVINFDSLVSTDNITSKISPNQEEWGKNAAEWLIDEIGGKGKLIAFNGPEGVAVSEQRWDGAKAVLDEYDDIEVVANIQSEYNMGPALEGIKPVLQAHQDVDGIISLGGALSSASLKALDNMDLDVIPITGEIYNGFLKDWYEYLDDGFTSFAVGQPNWLGVLAIDQAIRDLDGEDVDKEVDVPFPEITNDNIEDYVPNDDPDDYYPFKPLSDDEIEEILNVN